MLGHNIYSEFTIPSKMLFDKNLSKTAIRIFALISKEIENQQSVNTPGTPYGDMFIELSEDLIRDLCDELSKSKKYVRELIGKLVKKGFLSVENSSTCSRIYLGEHDIRAKGQQKDEYVYIKKEISTGNFKIGMGDKERATETGSSNSSVPLLEIVIKKQVLDAKCCEKRLHSRFKKKNVKGKKEFFELNDEELNEAKDFIKEKNSEWINKKSHDEEEAQKLSGWILRNQNLPKTVSSKPK